ncbi:hypothetical protein DRN74_05985 [Candidatus Micrarchaeota archaeon]|nr:MAG: hypothetical protein DRN74_05985 [Candidatus Micrarchaeota archaeon]
MTRKFVLLAISILLLAIGGTALFFSTFMIKEKRIIPVDVVVSNRAGFNLDPDAMHFGLLPRGGTGKRMIVINNSHNFPVDVVIKVYGNITPWIDLQPTPPIILVPKSKLKVNFTVSIPDNAKYGKYAGYIKILLKRRFK